MITTRGTDRLDSGSVTIASRVMLPTYPIVDVLYGVVFLTDPGGRAGLAPSLDIARTVVSLKALGALWLALAIAMVTARLTRRRGWYITALGINAVAWILWGVLVEAAVFTQSNVTYLAGVLPLFVTTTSTASILTLWKGDK